MESDAALVAAMAVGDGAAFETLYRRHAPAVWTVVRDHVHDSDHVADVVQEAFARALESLPRLTDPERFRPWLLSIARHTAIDARRADARVRREALDVVEDQPDRSAGPDEAAEVSELVALVRGSVAGLSHRDATAVGLVALGFGVADVAAALGVSHGAAKVALHRARRRLKAALLLAVLARRRAPACPGAEEAAASGLVALAGHLATCAACEEAARAGLYG